MFDLMLGFQASVYLSGFEEYMIDSTQSYCDTSIVNVGEKPPL